MKTWEYFIILEKEKLIENKCFVEKIPFVIYGNLDIWERVREEGRNQRITKFLRVRTFLSKIAMLGDFIFE